MTKGYTRDHEWIDVVDGVATVGITNYAQEQLGDVVFVEVPEVGRTLEQGGEAAVVESVKAASEVYAPISGEIVEANEALGDTPDLVNRDPEGAAWFFRMKPSAPEQLEVLLDEAVYKEFVETLRSD